MAAGKLGSNSLSTFLQSSQAKARPRKCSTCLDKELAAACAEFVALQRGGKLESWQSLRWFWKYYLVGKLGRTHLVYATINNHVRNCLAQ